MKKLIVLLLLLLPTICVPAYGAVITADDLKGDSAFVEKMLAVQKTDENVDENAVFVAPDGIDGNSGTIDKPYATVYQAIAKAKVGQTIYIRGGTYKQQNITITKSGTEDNYITIKNYPGEKPIFDHTDYTVDGGAMIDFGNVSYVHIEGLTLCNKNLKANSGYGIKMNRGNHIIIKNMEIYNINVPNPKSSEVGANAIILYATDAKNPISNVLIYGCYIHDCQTGWNEGVSVNGNSEYVNVINNKIADIGNIGLDFAGHFNACKDNSLDQARYCTAVGNVVSGCISPNATSYGLYNDGGRDNTFDRNIVYGCRGGIEIGSEEGGAYPDYPVKNVVVKNNLVYNNIEAGVSVGGYDNEDTGIVCNTKILNNTLVDNGNDNYGKELGFNKVDGVEVRNNILYKSISSELIKIRFTSELAKNFTFSNNCYYTVKTADSFYVSMYGNIINGFNAWKNAVGENGIYAEPLLNSEYKLTANSPCIDKGYLSDDIGIYDLANNLRAVDNIDIGCYEYQKGGVETSEVSSEMTTEATTESGSDTESTTEVTSSSTTESTTETTTEAATETTTSANANKKVWDLNSDELRAGVTVREVCSYDELTFRINSMSDSGFKLDKNDKTPKTDGYYLSLKADKGDKIVVYVNSTKAAGADVTLCMSDSAEKEIVAKTINAKKTGVYAVTFDIKKTDNYIIYTDESNASAPYYNKIELIYADKTVNGDEVWDKADAAIILKHCIGLEKITDADLLSIADLNKDGVIDIKDAILALNNMA